ncbi:MAG: hypothetical protein WD010_04610, partial [Nitriliruptor sp.]
MGPVGVGPVGVGPVDTIVVTLVVPLLMAPAGVAQEPTGNYQQVLDLTFPSRPDAGLTDTYDAC